MCKGNHPLLRSGLSLLLSWEHGPSPIVVIWASRKSS